MQKLEMAFKDREGFDQRVWNWLLLGILGLMLAVGLAQMSSHATTSLVAQELRTAKAELAQLTGQGEIVQDGQQPASIFTLGVALLTDGNQDPQLAMFWVHCSVYLFFLLGAWLLYTLLHELGYSQPFALVGMCLYLAHPVVFGNAFTNVRDIPLMAGILLSLLSLARFAKQKSVVAVIGHSLATGLAMALGAQGLWLLPLSVLLMLWVVMTEERDQRWFAGMLAILLPVSLLTALALLPGLWQNTAVNLSSYLAMGGGAWGGQELLLGKFYELAQLPMLHNFIYFVVSMPLGLLVLFGSGLLLAMKRVLIDQGLYQASALRSVFGLLSWFVIAQTLLITEPKFVNGFQQMLFLTPLSILAALEALEWLWQLQFEGLMGRLGALGKPLLAIAVAVQLFVLVVFSMQTSPYQMNYYNWLAGRKLSAARLNFVMDPNGEAYAEALRKLTAANPNGKLVVRVDELSAAKQNLGLLPADQQKRVQLIEMGSNKKDNFMLLSYRNSVYLDRKDYELVDSVTVRGAVINGIYRRLK